MRPKDMFPVVDTHFSYGKSLLNFLHCVFAMLYIVGKEYRCNSFSDLKHNVFLLIEI